MQPRLGGRAWAPPPPWPGGGGGRDKDPSSGAGRWGALRGIGNNRGSRPMCGCIREMGKQEARRGPTVLDSANTPSASGPYDLGFEPLVGPGRTPKATSQGPRARGTAFRGPGGSNLGTRRALGPGGGGGTYPARCGGRRPRVDGAGAEPGAQRGAWLGGPTGPRCELSAFTSRARVARRVAAWCAAGRFCSPGGRRGPAGVGAKAAWR